MRDLFLCSPLPTPLSQPPDQVIYDSIHCDANEFYLTVFNWISWLHTMTFHSWEVVLNLIHSKGKSLQFIGCERSQVKCVLMVSARGLVLSIPKHQAGLNQLLSWQSEHQTPYESTVEKAAEHLAVPVGVSIAWRAPLNPKYVLPSMKHRGPTQLDLIFWHSNYRKGFFFFWRC